VTSSLCPAPLEVVNTGRKRAIVLVCTCSAFAPCFLVTPLIQEMAPTYGTGELDWTARSLQVRKISFNLTLADRCEHPTTPTIKTRKKGDKSEGDGVCCN